MLKAIYAQEDRESALEKAQNMVSKVKGMKLPEAAKKVEQCIAEILTDISFPSEY